MAKNTPRYSRKPPDFSAKIKDAHALRVGRLSMGWNELHDRFFLLFWAFLGDRSSARAHALWHTVASDKTQREMTVAAAIGILPPRRLASLKWLANCASTIGSDRNAIIHVHMLHTSDEKGDLKLTPDPLVPRPATHRRLTEKSDDRTWQRLTADLRVLSHYANDMFLHLSFGSAQIPWPRRPRLPHLEGAVRKRPRRLPRQRPPRRKPPPTTSPV